MDMRAFELEPQQLRYTSDPSQLAFETTADLERLQRIIGQERATGAIEFGIDIRAQGYNIYVAGPAGSGRTTVAREFLERSARVRPAPPEWCYVYNFEDPRRPKALALAAGRASELRRVMAEFVEQLQSEIPRAFEGEFYEQRRREIMLNLEQRQQELLQQLEKYLNERGFALIRNQMGLAIAPMVNGQVIGGEEYEKLDAETKRRLESYRPELREQFDKTMRLTRDLDREGRQAMEKITQELAGFIVDQLMEDAREKFKNQDKVLAYLGAVRKDVVENVGRFLPDTEEKNPLMLDPARRREQWIARYSVSVLAEACAEACAPIVVEDNPTYHNLVGRIEYRAEFGTMVTDFTQIRAGALHRANGGYLVIEAKNLISSPLAWEGLKRALRNREVKIEDIAQFYGSMATSTLEPEPIPLDVKVVIIGEEQLYQLLYTYDEDFRELFKVKAQFATSMPLDEQATEDYARFVATLTQDEKLRPFDRAAVARVIDEARRYAGDQQKVTTRMAQVADLVREASFWAGQDGRDVVAASDVQRAVDQRIYRQDYVAERYLENIRDGIILIDTQGEVVGQINGLSVMEMANFEFGMPSRVTAKTYLGRSGVVSIDREVKMSGPIHDKGQLILSSYLAGRFAQRQPLSMSASLTFEQNYGGIEGDSASSTELYALLSSLSGIPIKQNLAVTGSVNQFGQVQAIGGVNAKIEGFFAVCQARGLTGDQGVLVPQSNVRHLMLRDQVVQAVRAGLFHIYAVSTIEEGIELLTGTPAGEADANGQYPEGTVYQRVQARLHEYEERLKEAGKPDEKGHPKGEADEQAVSQPEEPVGD